MEKYELLYILPAKFTEEELKPLAEKIKAIVENHGGEVTEEHYMGKRKLAYPIKHIRVGHYYLIIFNADTPVIAKINATLRLTADLLRHLIVKRDPYIQGVPKLAEEMHIVQRERGDRGKDRRRGPSDRQAKPAPAESDKPAQKPAAKEAITIDDLDKKLDKILTDDIL